MLDESTVQSDIESTLARPLEEISHEEIDLLVAQLETEINKINRMCNFILNRPRGLNIHALETLHHIKVDLSWLKWHCQSAHEPDGPAQA